MTAQPDAFSLRRATAEDSRAAFDVQLFSLVDLTDRLHTRWDVEPEEQWRKLRFLYEFLAAHAAEWWMAEDQSSGEPIGYARSIERGGLLELSEFFVLPGHQSAGVGAALLARAFPEGRGEVRVIVATTDVRAQARYYRAGTTVLFPIVELRGEPRGSEPARGFEPARDLDAVRLAPDDAGRLAAVARIEAAVLEFDRGDELAWLAGRREGYLYRRSGADIGFGFVGLEGTGPIATLDPVDQPAILDHLCSRAAVLGREELSFEVPMVNGVAVRHLLDRGLRLDPFYTYLMSNRPFGRFDRYVGFSPPFVL